jgi:hypothetical protein
MKNLVKEDKENEKIFPKEEGAVNAKVNLSPYQVNSF